MKIPLESTLDAPTSSLEADSPERHSRESGFALIISLSLMAFLLLLVISLVTLTRIETQSATINLTRVEARTNAVLGMQIALGQLQQYAGADQRATAPATTVYPNKDEIIYGENSLYRSQAGEARNRSYLDNPETWLTPGERTAFDQSMNDWWEDKNPHWVSVWNTALRDSPTVGDQIYEDDPGETLFGEPVRAYEQKPNNQESFQVPVWLVSGNERIEFPDALTRLTSGNPGSIYPAGYLTPDMTIEEMVQAAGAEDSDVIDIVGYGSAAAAPSSPGALDGSADGLDGKVRVIRQGIGGDEDAHYAYWVGDESTKANFSIRAPEQWVDASSGTREARNMLQVPQRVGWENMEGFAGVGSLSPNDPDFEKVLFAEQIPLLDPNLDDPNPGSETDERGPLPRNFHSMTGYSAGLFTDPVLGGLKKDLSAYVTRGNGLNDGDFIADPSRYVNNDPRFAAAGGNNSGFPLSTSMKLTQNFNPANRFPTFGQIKNWYDNEASGGSVQPSASTAPVLTYLGFYQGFSVEGTVRRQVRYHFAPQVILWNPYDSDLALATYTIEVGINPTFDHFYLVAPEAVKNGTESDPDFSWAEYLANNKENDENGVPKYVDDEGNPIEDDHTNGTFDREGNFYYSFEPSNTDRISLSPLASRGGRVRDEGLLEGRSGWRNGFSVFQDEVDDLDHTTYSGYPKIPGTDDYLRARREVGGKGIVQMDPRTGPRRTNEADIIVRLEIQAALPAGQATIFSLANDVPNWNPDQNALSLAPGLDEARGPTAWFPVVEAHKAMRPDTRWMAIAKGNEATQPYARLLVNGDTVSESAKFGERPGGQDFGTTQPNGYQKLDVSTWRDLHSTTDFSTNFTGDYENATDSAFPLYRAYVQPFASGLFTSSDEDDFLSDLVKAGGGISRRGYYGYLPMFSRFNLGATSLSPNPIVEETRTGGQNYGSANERNTDNMLAMSPPVFSDVKFDWEEEQHNGDEGYALIAVRDRNGNNDSILQPVSSLSIRNAKRPQSELLSLGQLQGINLSPFYWMPASPIGNSYAPIYADREAIAGINSRTVGWDANSFNLGNRLVPNDEQNMQLDLAYLLNENLWDRYFISSIPDSNSGWSLDNSEPLPNSRHRFKDAEGLSKSDVRDFDDAAVYLRNHGAFNVNSTSVEAWKALLTAFRQDAADNFDIAIESQSNDENPDETVGIARSLDPISDAIDFVFSDGNADEDSYGAGGNRDLSNVVSGFRYLTDDMIQALAERIVDEVRIRGPFFSLADFVNRRLVTPDRSGNAWYEARTNNAQIKGVELIDDDYDPVIGLTGLNGALQRAIDLSGINGGVNYPDNLDQDKDAAYGLTISNTSDGPSDDTLHLRLEPARKHHLDAEHIAGAPASEAGQLLSGAPGFITQADLLAMIAPALTTRGDTFKIRSYGDTIDPATGEITTRAYLETIVQRTIDPVNPGGSNSDGIDGEWIPTDSLGRRFEIVSVRWISPDEI